MHTKAIRHMFQDKFKKNNNNYNNMAITKILKWAKIIMKLTQTYSQSRES